MPPEQRAPPEANLHNKDASETNALVFRLKVAGSDITQEMIRERQTARNAESHQMQLVQINAIKTMLVPPRDGLEQLQLK